ncbi:SbcC/MukB-like Walker B domain-containing protein [Actinomadura fulvescens]|uniref:SbcC/MukB-like Walker B domain-containing protein n=1 Tax=Actinomadura fulvescens TaxID=46160 RepID=UPI0031DA6A71
MSGGVRLRRPLGLPGLALAGELGTLEEALHAYDEAQDGDVRVRITALRTLADDIGERLGSPSADVSDTLILRRGEELRDGLAGGYDSEIDEIDGVKRFTLHDDTGAHDVAVVGARLRAAAAEARLHLSNREQEVFERYLLGELGDHLSRQVLAAHTLIERMNATLDQVRSSHGIGARLVWELATGSDADIRAAVALLRHPSALRTRDQSAQLRDALRRRIEEARLTDPSAGYALHLRTALDYRTWFAFKVKVTDSAHPERERVLSHRTALSQGEQRVVSYLVLFATAAAHFSSVAEAAPNAPRLILLDDAFAKVDEPTHGRLLGLLVDLDLDFIITSERLWGCFPTVPSLHIYECLRDPHVRGVATVHFTWDGQRKHLVSV